MKEKGYLQTYYGRSGIKEYDGSEDCSVYQIENTDLVEFCEYLRAIQIPCCFSLNWITEKSTAECATSFRRAKGISLSSTVRICFQKTITKEFTIF